MEFDKNNFDQCFENIKSKIDQCDFLAIDTELTGLNINKTNLFDTPQLRYVHLKDNAMQYTITQFGICLFKYNIDIDCIEYTPINFHLLPSKQSEKDNFTVNIDTIHFLNSTNFDYNKSWRDGVSFIRYSEYEKQIEDDILRRKYHLESAEKEAKIDNDYFIDFEKIIKDCETFLNNDDEEEMRKEVKEFSFYQRYLIKESLSNKVGCVNGKYIFPHFEYDTQSKKSIIRFVKCIDFKEYKYKCINNEHDKREIKLKEKLKFSEIIKQISDSKKFIIGHNCFLDCLHMYDKFIGPLPDTFQDFKIKFHELFPNYIDTKHLVFQSKHLVFKNIPHSNLKHCYEASFNLTNNPKYSPSDDSCKFTDGGDKFHQAHYDAWATGTLFLNLSRELTALNNGDCPDFGKYFQTEAPLLLKTYTNKLNFIHSDSSVIDLNPSKVEEKNLRSDVFHLSFTNLHWQSSDVYVYLAQCLNKPLSLVYDYVQLNWIDRGSLMFKVRDKINPSEVSVGLHGDATITKFAQYYKLEDNSIMEKDGFTMAKSRKRKRN